METDKFLDSTDKLMQKASDFVATEMSSIRTGKAHPALLDNIIVKVESYGSSMNIKQLALVSVPESRLLLVQPHDPSTIKDIERSLIESNLGITPSSDGRVIRLPIPDLSEERRKDLVKVIKDIAEKGKVSIRSLRKDSMDKLKLELKHSNITEDSFHDMEKEVQSLTDKHIKEIDKYLLAKENDIMTI